MPTVYAVVPLTQELNFGLGVFSPYGLGFRWDNPDTFAGRFISQNAVVQTADINPVFSYQLLPELSIAAGADYRFSKVQLERNVAAINVFTQSVVDVAHVKLNSELTDNHGWGWNAGILYKPIPQFSLGAAYRSKIKVDYEGTAKFTQILTGNAAFDAAVAAGLPTGTPPVTTSIEFPGDRSTSAPPSISPATSLSLEADWTRWTSFQALDIHFPTLTGRDIAPGNGLEELLGVPRRDQQEDGARGPSASATTATRRRSRSRTADPSSPTTTATRTRPASASAPSSGVDRHLRPLPEGQGFQHGGTVE